MLPAGGGVGIFKSMFGGGKSWGVAARLGVLLIVFASLSACSSINKRIIKPAWNSITAQKSENAPYPVPLPRAKPKPPITAVASNAKIPKTKPARAGQMAASSATSVYTVKKGDTLYAISRRYSVPVRDLIRTNGFKAPYALEIGQRVSVPSARVHVVKKGETGYGISRAYGVTVAALMQENGIKAPYTLEIGQTLRLPGGAAAATAQTASRTPTVTRPAQTTGRTVARPVPPQRSASGFDWPVEGRLASRFGPKEDGLHNDGINILARQGTPVRSSDAGVVVYASNALEGYGHLLLVKHAGGWITAYAHNERLLVREGQTVKKGQIIARVGRTGGVTEPQLHFEIRKGKRALDPLRYLRRQNAANPVLSRG